MGTEVEVICEVRRDEDCVNEGVAVAVDATDPFVRVWLCCCCCCCC